MGNIVRLVVLIFNIVLFSTVKIEEQSDVLITYLLIFNTLSFVGVYFFDFNPLSKKKGNNLLKLEDDIKNSPFKTKVYSEIKYSLFENKLNWLVLLFPLVFLLFVESHDFKILDVIFSFIIFLHLVLNICILSILIRNYYKKLYILYIIMIGIIFQTYNSLFLLTKVNLFWYSVSLILVSYVFIVILSFRINKLMKK